MKKNAELAELTFPVSGITVHAPQMSRYRYAVKIQRKYPPPEPPRQLVDYGGGHKVWETNYSSPEYKAARADHAIFLEEKAQQIMVERAVLSIAMNDDHRKMLAEWKEENPGLFDTDDKDQQIFFEEICIQADEDFEAFMIHVMGVDPSEVEIEEATNGFPGDVQGDSNNGVDHATERDQVRES